MTPAEIKQKLEQMGAQPKKALGQNFLINDLVIEKIVNKVASQNANYLIEIGPGLGALTESLIGLNKSMYLLELDSIFFSYWQQRAEELRAVDKNSIQVIDGDALRWEGWNQLTETENAMLVSNLPYQISSSLVIDRSVEAPFLGSMVLMFQKEVAQRITARSKTENYGLLSVISQAFWQVENVAEAGPRDFFPPPQIASRVLFFKRKPSTVKNPSGFLKWVKVGFLHRRKLLKSNLGALCKNPEELLLKLSLNPQSRAEELTIAQWIDLWSLHEHSRNL
jgi:16S rRNA (adenine1518-N6/adenine1519-N6)-dimethyltransferase